MRSIAAEAGCTTGLVTHYFANKDELLDAMIHRIARLAGQRLRAARAGLVGMESLRALLVTSMPLVPEHASEWRIWISLWDRSIANGRLRDEWQRRSSGWIGLVRRTLEQAVKEGELVPETPIDTIAESLTVTHYGICVTAVLTPERFEAVDAVRIIDDQLDAIRARYGVSEPTRWQPREVPG